MEPLEAIQKQLEEKIPGLKLTPEGAGFLVDRKDLLTVARFLKENEPYKMDYVSNLCGVDYKEYLESVAYLYSMEKKEGPILLKVRVSREDPKVPSLTPLFRGAEYQEREAYDMFGIIYEGHPDLRRILMWEEFVHYPLRKDYKPEDQDLLEDEKQPPEAIQGGK